MNKRWLMGGGAAAVAAGIAGAVVAISGGGSGEPVAPPTTGVTGSASPAVTASVSSSGSALEPPVDGAIPVPAFPASAIPWLEVGPGWFLLSYDQEAAPFAWPETGQAQFPPLDATLMLVAPMGDLYYVRSLDGFGPGRVKVWLGGGVGILDGYAMTDTDEIFHGPLSSVDLDTGETTVVNSDFSMSGSIERVLPDGRFAVAGLDAEGSEWIGLMDPDFNYVDSAGGGCWSTYGAVTPLAPDGARVVCLEWDNEKSAVMLHNLIEGLSSKIDTFKYDPWAYQTHGWWDADSFVLTREDDSGKTLWWAYNVSSRKLRDLKATLSNGTPAQDARGMDGYRVVSAGSTVEVQGFDGSLRATLPCSPRAISGHVAMTVCGEAGGRMEISVADLDSGEVTMVASFDSGADVSLESFAWPAGL